MKTKEIWLVNLDPTKGAEISKRRPAVIVNDDTVGLLPLRVIVPITNWSVRYEVADWMVKISPDNKNNLTKESAIDCFQIKSLSVDRLERKIGVIADEYYEKLKIALKHVLNL